MSNIPGGKYEHQVELWSPKKKFFRAKPFDRTICFYLFSHPTPSTLKEILEGYRPCRVAQPFSGLCQQRARCCSAAYANRNPREFSYNMTANATAAVYCLLLMKLLKASCSVFSMKHKISDGNQSSSRTHGDSSLRFPPGVPQRFHLAVTSLSVRGAISRDEAGGVSLLA